MSNNATATQPDAVPERRATVTISLTPQLLERVDAAAANELRTRSNYIESRLNNLLPNPQPEADAE